MLPSSRPLLRTRFLFPRINTFLSPKSLRQRSQRHQHRSTRSNAHSSNTGNANVSASANSSWWSGPLMIPAATSIAAFIGSGLAFAINKYQQQSILQQQLGSTEDSSLLNRQFGDLTNSGWAKKIKEEPGAMKVLTAEQLLCQEHPFLEDDHMFSAFVARGIIHDMEGWYLPKNKKFSAIVALGREVAGFPRVVHGGLTAAIFDEVFGGLLYSLKKTGGVNFIGPAYTVQLEVSYKSKITAGKTVLCSAEVESLEGRKLWMKATMSDGPDGTVYATARALFVAPKPLRLVMDVAKYLGQRLGEVVVGPRSHDDSNKQQ